MQLARTGLDGNVNGDVFSTEVVMIFVEWGREGIVIGRCEPFDHGMGDGNQQWSDRTNSGRKVSSTIHVVQGLDEIDAAGRTKRGGESKRLAKKGPRGCWMGIKRVADACLLDQRNPDSSLAM